MSNMSVPTLFPAIRYMVRREILLAFRLRHELINPLAFFVITIVLFPLAIGSDPALLKTLAPGIVWVAALLATLLSLTHLFQSDYADGTLQQFVLSPQPLSVLMLIKVLAHWLVTGLPLVLLAPLLGILLNLPVDTIKILFISLLLGTMILHLIGAMGAALTVGLRHASLLLALLVLPLYIPVLIFGASAVAASANHLPAVGQLAWLATLLMIALCLTPLTIAAVLRTGAH